MGIATRVLFLFHTAYELLAATTNIFNPTRFDPTAFDSTAHRWMMGLGFAQVSLALTTLLFSTDTDKPAGLKASIIVGVFHAAVVGRMVLAWNAGEPPMMVAITSHSALCVAFLLYQLSWLGGKSKHAKD
mmetsp:Transcript_24362/g.57629  ORF Transcript_24362/g.57629 Transcript_24362/m.57629 type:complete len:130 (+) Transcript_24362:13-402(+)|eukprot:CAMPEP_0175899456 /NCGR_PEP_ID=MMETSP0108-20121206/1812_1 /TAXON_ID=195067 ORGANISM="Goniomonas pacifica, Strain CCMP1869" /NCGR_SAMPLE_ID=MMETSP0108 /ASSEMBLY_ACC=CAM_ASM_000204 /LENGTH=129 /DNA_ID=CAMNT_0017220921 /DNA_START=13 /DNA_END=402 /DNA_ORIENTATION=+